MESCGIYISQLLRFARACTTIAQPDFHSTNDQPTDKRLTQCYMQIPHIMQIIHNVGCIYKVKGRRVNWNFSYSLLWWLNYKLRRVKGSDSFFSSGTKIAKRIWRRQNDPKIILCLVPLQPFKEPFLEHCTLTNNRWGTSWQVLSQPYRKRHGNDLYPFWLIAGVDNLTQN